MQYSVTANASPTTKLICPVSVPGINPSKGVAYGHMYVRFRPASVPVT